MSHTIYLYDEIGPEYYGLLGGKWMADELAKAGGAPVDLRINSPGGSVFDGQAMYTLLKSYGGNVTAHIDSLAASAASFVAMAAGEIKIAENAMIMIHSAWGLTIGNAQEHMAAADLLFKVDDGIVAQYAARTGQDAAQIKEWMAAETWMSAQEAVDRGFADSIGSPLAVKASVREGQFAKTPAHFLSAKANISPRVEAKALERRLAVARAFA